MTRFQPSTPLNIDLRALILDDDSSARSNLRSSLARAGVTRVVEASVSSDEHFKGHISRVDMIFSEVHFRAGSGLRVLQALRDGRLAPINCDTPFVFTTEVADVETATKAASLSVDGLLIKPVTYEGLCAVLVRMGHTRSRFNSSQASRGRLLSPFTAARH